MTCDTTARLILISGLVLTFVAACLTLAVWSALALVDAVARRGAAAPGERDAGPELLHGERGAVAGEAGPTSGGAA